MGKMGEAGEQVQTSRYKISIHYNVQKGVSTVEGNKYCGVFENC